MALINCSECNNQISDKAPTCPNCGAPNQVKEQPAQQQAPPQVRVESNLNQHKGAEVVYYSNGNGVKITNTRFVVNSATYPLNGITSIKAVEIQVSKTPALLLMLLGAVLLIAGMNGRNAAALAVLGVLIIAAGVWLWNRIKNDFAVKITTSAAETNALISKNEEYISQVTRALNEAIIHRG